MDLKPQPQPVPGLSARMDPQPDYGEASYRGSGKLTGRAAVITGGDSGIGRAVALAYMLGAAPDLDAAFEYAADREAARDFRTTSIARSKRTRRNDVAEAIGRGGQRGRYARAARRPAAGAGDHRR